MHNQRIYNLNIAIERLKNYCALQDRCQSEVLQKMKNWGLQEASQEHILEMLITQQYIDEERFSISFCRGKFRIKKWGKNKIKHALEKKHISHICIKKGLDEIDEAEYIKIIESLVEKQNMKITDKNLFTRKNKIARFLIQKGFENQLVWEKLKILDDK